jgi:hypothetical protein
MMWTPTIPRKCYTPKTSQALAFTHAALNILTDFIFAVVIPIPMLWGLNMNKRTKFAVMGILSLGIFVCLAGILRIPTIVNYGKAGDFLWDSNGLCIWFVAELNTGIMAGSFPALKPLFKKLLDSTYLGGSGNKYGNKYGYGVQSGGHGGHNQSAKGFQNIVVSQRSRSGNDDDISDDFDGANSQRDLVLPHHGQKDIALGVIQKDVVTTVTRVDATPTSKGPGNRRSGRGGYAWDQ